MIHCMSGAREENDMTRVRCGWCLGALALAAVVSCARAATAEASAVATTAPAVPQQASAILDEYEEATERFRAELQNTASEAGRLMLVRTKTPDRKAYARRALELARQHAADAEAVDAVAIELCLIAQNMDPDSVALAGQGLDLLSAHHLNSPSLPVAFQWLQMRPSVKGEAFLRGVMDKSSNRSNRGRALLALAGYFRQQYKFAERFKVLPEFRDQIIKDTKEYDRDVANAVPENSDKPLAQAKSLYRQVADEYADVKGPAGPIAAEASNILYAIDHRSVGNKAPDIEGQTIDGTPMKLGDYRGKVVVLDFWGDW